MSNTLKTEGIVFRSIKYSETSLILDVFTKDVGLHSFIVSGVRKAKSRMANVFHPINIINIVAFYSEDKLSRIKEAHYASKYDDITFNVIKSSIAMYIVDLSRHAIKEKEANLGLYNFIKMSLLKIDKGQVDLKLMPIVFTIQLASYLGFEIQNNYTVLDKYFDLKEGLFVDKNVGHNYILSEKLSLKLNAILNNNKVDMLKSERNDLLDQLINYYRYHIEGFKPLKSLSVLRTVLS